MLKLLPQRKVLIHPMVVGELALGPLREREQTLFALDGLPSIGMAQHSEVRRLIENHHLYSRGIGFTDAHLLASVLIHRPATLWTRDKRLTTIGEEFGVQAEL